MADVDLRRLKELFGEAVELQPAEREALLQSACGENAALRRKIDRMLAAHDLAGDFLAQPTLATAETILEASEPAPLPERIGRYRVKRVIAAGGMGVVYEAVQERPHRTVALKVMRPGVASQSSQRRFEYESQILARLRHPNIAQVYEAGTHDDGGGAVAYFAMEYVPNAKTLIEYATDKKLDTRRRLSLFAKVCDAVHHGHLKGIVHRDLKPGNILVDADGEPKIIDFGVARSTDSDLAVTTLQTDVGQLIGTLQYMSPEQCDADPHDLDSRSDVYALGVVLYELLCDRLPYDLAHAAVHEAVRVIRDESPIRPSTVNRTLRGDLETITLMALEKERVRRYQSASDLAADVRRYLTDEPVVARPASALYHFRKFARRNRTLVGGIAASFVLLLAGTAGIAWQWQAARTEAARATTINDYLMHLFAMINPGEGMTDGLRTPEPGGGLPNIRELIDEAAAGLDLELADWPIVQADLHLRLGRTYWGLGRFEQARHHIGRAHELRAETLGDDHVDTMMALMWRGWCIAHTLGPSAEAGQYLRKATDGLQRRLGPHDPRTLNSRIWMTGLMGVQRPGREVEQAHRDVWATCREALGPDHRVTILATARLAFFLTERKYIDREQRFAEAEELVAKPYERLRDSPLAEDAFFRTLSMIRGLVFRGTGRLEQALEVFEHTNKLGQRDGRPGLTITDIRVTKNLAATLVDLGRVEEAGTLWQEQAEAARAVLGDHPFTVWLIERHAAFLSQRERYAEAESLLLDCLNQYATALGEYTFHVAIARQQLVFALMSQQKYREAEPHARKVVEGFRRAGWSPEMWLPYSLQQLATCLQRLEKMDEAEGFRRERVEILRHAYGDEHANTLGPANGLAWFLKDRGKLQQAEALARQTVEASRRALGEDHDTTIASADTWAVILYLQGRYSDAVAEFDLVVPVARRKWGKQYLERMSSVVYGRCLTELGRYEDARDILLATHESGDASALDALIDLHDKWGKPEKGAEYRVLLQEAEGSAVSD